MGIEIRIPCLKDKNWPHVRCFLQNVYNSGVAESLSQLSKLDTKIKFRYVSDAFSGTSLLFVSPSQHAKPRRQEHEWHRAGSAPDLLGQPLLESEKVERRLKSRNNEYNQVLLEAPVWVQCFTLFIYCCAQAHAPHAGKHAAHVKTECISEESSWTEGQSTLPDSCAPVSFAEWENLPECTPLCNADLLRAGRNLVMDPACESCIAGEECNCTVSCETGFEIHGGGPPGPRSCSLEDLSLGPAPVCRQPQAGEPGHLPTCPTPEVAHAAVDCQCHESPDGCTCPIFRLHTHGNIKAEEAPEGDKQCTIEDQMPPAATCSDLSKEEDCLGHSQEGEPCCFREEGLYANCHDGGCEAIPSSVCAPRSDPKMFFVPTSCAKSLFSKWQEMPDCQPRCVPKNLVGDHLDLKDCDNCIAGQTCDCKVKCMDGFERVGGGSEGDRSCTVDALDFEEAPVCQEKEATPQCEAVFSTDSFTASPDCAACRADEPCDCKVECQKGFKIFTDVQEGEKKCYKDPDYALKKSTEACAEFHSEEECLEGEADGVPCCWRGSLELDSTGKPVGAGWGGRLCAKKGDSMIKRHTPPDACAATQGAKMDPLPVCKQLCVNQFATAQNVVEENCDECFVGEECGCTVKCEEGMIQKSGEKGSKKCGDGEDKTSFGEPLVCEPKKPPEVPRCPTPRDVAWKVSGCRNCKAGDKNCKCDVRCETGYKHTGGGEPGSKECVSKIYECAPSLTWKDGQCLAGGKPEYTFCCHEAIEGTVELDASSDCASLTKERLCLGGKDLTTQEACCWRAEGFTDGKKCAARGSAVITNDHRVQACADRPKILWGLYEDLPMCQEKCKNPYQATYKQMIYGGFGLKVTGCDDCVPGEKDCNCKVNCKQGYVHVGGGKEDKDGMRMCDAKTKSFPLAPTCMKKPSPPQCSDPSEEDTLKVKGCRFCTPGEKCDCKIECPYGSGHNSGSTGNKECTAVPATLTEATCSEIKSKHSCLSSAESKMPCCYRQAGFGNPLHVCAKQGSEDIQDAPDKCARLEVAIFPDLPNCVPICLKSFHLQGRSYKTENCERCLADTPCDCKMTCRDNYEYVGGEQGCPVRNRVAAKEGSRGCTVSNTYLPPPPVCHKKDVPKCTEPDKDSLQKVRLSNCGSCIAGSTDCRCTATCLPEHILMPGSEVKEGLKRCLAVDATSGAMPCEEITSGKNCAKKLYNGKRCCWERGMMGYGNCYTQGSSKMSKWGDTDKPKCAPLQVGRYEDFPTCVPTCKKKFHEYPGLDYDKKVCDVCTPKRYPGQEACQCSVKCAEGFRPVGGPPEGPRSCDPNDKHGGGASISGGAFLSPPACIKKLDPPRCSRPEMPGMKAGRAERVRGDR
ncbi:unnamed protein product [Durusdinium trenchii]|uniref:Uncharacterized protein n=1 Tax=Durusdinium trenchii TaxID=1381693 RepID=A0ABP0PDU5_9DINO